jgi:hypothetical protein
MRPNTASLSCKAKIAAVKADTRKLAQTERVRTRASPPDCPSDWPRFPYCLRRCEEWPRAVARLDMRFPAVSGSTLEPIT